MEEDITTKMAKVSQFWLHDFVTKFISNFEQF
jgi:hypothetical protein